MKTRKIIFALAALITITACDKNPSSSSSSDGSGNVSSSETSPLDGRKNEAIAEINAAVAALKEDDYFNENWAILLELQSDALSDIEEQTTIEEVEAAEAAALKDLKGVLTIAGEQKRAKGELDGYLKNFVIPQNKYTPGVAVKTAVDAIVKKAKEDIDKVNDPSSYSLLAEIIDDVRAPIISEYSSEIHFAADHITFARTPLAISDDEWVTIPGMTDSKTYWSNVNWNLRGEALLQAIRTEMRKTFVKVDYNGALSAVKEMDKDPNNSANIISLYDLKSQRANGFNGGAWNREHTFPQSKLYEDGKRAADASTNPKNIATDVANIFACDAHLNTNRSNDSYIDWDYNSDPETFYKRLQINTDGQLTDNIRYLGYSPTPLVRGEIARAQLYMLVNWAGDVSRDSNFAVNTMLDWDMKYAPIQERDAQRQAGILKYQHIRNPFIDNRKAACYIWSDVNSRTRNLCADII